MRVGKWITLGTCSDAFTFHQISAAQVVSGPRSCGAQCMAGKGEGLDHLAYAAHHSHSTSGEIKLGRRRDWLRGGSSEHRQSSPQAVTRPPVTFFISCNFWSIGFSPGLVPPSFPRQDLQLIVEVFHRFAQPHEHSSRALFSSGIASSVSSST